ncbi:MAG: hypothetical protein JSU07_07065, partial [Bacteroidetes bacterium]|nr:hypothetical protein [Bacteroidota bacterium]
EFMNGNLSTHILNSPNSFNHSQNNTINEKDFIDQLICAKNETIQAQKEQIELLKTQILALQSKRG